MHCASGSVILYTFILLFTCFHVSHSSGYADIFQLAKTIVYGDEVSKTVDTVEKTLQNTASNFEIAAKDSFKEAVSQHGLKNSIEEKFENKNQRLIQKIKELNKKRLRRRKLLTKGDKGDQGDKGDKGNKGENIYQGHFDQTKATASEYKFTL